MSGKKCKVINGVAIGAAVVVAVSAVAIVAAVSVYMKKKKQADDAAKSILHDKWLASTYGVVPPGTTDSFILSGFPLTGADCKAVGDITGAERDPTAWGDCKLSLLLAGGMGWSPRASIKGTAPAYGPLALEDAAKIPDLCAKVIGGQPGDMDESACSLALVPLDQGPGKYRIASTFLDTAGMKTFNITLTGTKNCVIFGGTEDGTKCTHMKLVRDPSA